MTHRFDPYRVTVHESHRDTHPARRKIGSRVNGTVRPCCGATAGTSVHAPMT